MSPERDEALGVLAERVGRLESDRKEDRQALQSFSNRMDQHIAELRALITTTVATIKYVDEKTYDRDRLAFFEALKNVKDGAEKGIAEAKADAERGIKIAWGIAVAFAVPFIGGLATIIMKAAG